MKISRTFSPNEVRNWDEDVQIRPHYESRLPREWEYKWEQSGSKIRESRQMTLYGMGEWARDCKITAKSVQEGDYEKTKRQEIDVPKAKRGKKRKRGRLKMPRVSIAL